MQWLTLLFASWFFVTVHKLLNRVVTPDEVDYQRESADEIAEEAHEYTVSVERACCCRLA